MLHNFAAYMTDAIQAVTAVTAGAKAATQYKTESYEVDLLAACISFIRGQSSFEPDGSTAQ